MGLVTQQVLRCKKGLWEQEEKNRYRELSWLALSVAGQWVE